MSVNTSFVKPLLMVLILSSMFLWSGKAPGIGYTLSYMGASRQSNIHLFSLVKVEAVHRPSEKVIALLNRIFYLNFVKYNTQNLHYAHQGTASKTIPASKVKAQCTKNTRTIDASEKEMSFIYQSNIFSWCFLISFSKKLSAALMLINP